MLHMSCTCCGRNGHIAQDCPLWNTACGLCGKLGHDKAFCPSTPKADKHSGDTSNGHSTQLRSALYNVLTSACTQLTCSNVQRS